MAGFRLTDTTVYSQPQTELIARTGRQLRQLCDGLLAELMQVVRIRPLLARRLVADRVLSVLSRLGRWLPTTTNAQISAFATAWLAALDLTDASGLMPITLADGQVRLALQRKACCFDYRRAGGKYCATCPKQPLTTRIQRLQQQ